MGKYVAACKNHERIRSEYSAYSLDLELYWKLTVSPLVVYKVFGTQAVTAEQKRELCVAKTRTVQLAMMPHYDEIPFREPLSGSALYFALKPNMQGNPRNQHRRLR